MPPPVLIVDDNAVNRFAMQTLVRQLGFDVAIAASAEEALTATRARTFAVILLDLMMPVVDGYETARRLRIAGITTPIIAVTALDDTDMIRARCTEAGIDDVIMKPIDSIVLAEKLSGAHSPNMTLTPKALRAIYGAQDLPTILATFVEVTRALMNRLEEAMHAHLNDEVRRSIHELKSATSQLYAGELTDLCKQLETAREQGDWAKMATLYQTLTKALDKVVSVITAESSM